MANRYQTFREDDLGAGIDNQSAENKISPGYAEDIKNMDPQSTGSIRTRAGYQGYLGHVPVRVKRVEYTDDSTDNLCFFLDGSVSLQSVDLTNIRSTPLIVQGRTSSDNINNAGDFPTTDSIQYYPGFITDFRKNFLVGTNTLTIPQDEHTLTTEYMFIGVTESTSIINSSNNLFSPNTIRIDKTTKDIEIDYTNGTGSAFEGFVYISDKSAVTGTNYVSGSTVINTGTNTYTITAATHSLNNFNIIAKIYEDDGTDLIEILPQEVRVLTNGNVEFDIVNGTGAIFNARFILTSAPSANLLNGSVAANSSTSLVISDIESDFLFLGIYLELTPGGILELVIPDSVVIDSAAKTATISFQNNSGSGRNFEIYYQFATIATNKLCVDASVIGVGDVFTDSTPQLTIWGIPHTELYGTDRAARQGWVNHIDSYRSTGEDRLICGLGGNLFSAQLSTEGSTATDYLMPTLYPNIRGRAASDQVIGPVFIDTSDTSSRTRGYIKGQTSGSNFAEISQATYISGTGWTVYRVEIPGMVISGALGTIISTVSGTADYLTVQQMGYSRLNGTFKIKQVTQFADRLDIHVENPSITSSDYDESDAGGLAGIFTDRFTLTATSQFESGDLISSELFSNLEVTGNSAATVLLGNANEQISIPAGLRITGTRTTDVIPLRDLDGTASIENLVRGDMVSWTPVDRLVRVLYINPEADTSVSITASNNTATILLGSGDTNRFAIGQSILIRGTTNYNGSQVITGIPDTTSLEFSSIYSTSESGTLVGKTASLDESLEITDTVSSSNSFSVVGRWLPVEAPDDSFNLTPSTYVSHFDYNNYTNQDIIRSAMVQDNLYLTNGNDEVMKFDGQNIYRAGLFRWQPHLFVSRDTTSTGKIVLQNSNINYTASSANRFTVTQEDRLTFQINTEIEDSIDNERYTIIDTLDDGTTAQIIVDREILSTFAGTPTLTEVSNFKYYFRLNAVDANQNLIASAVTGADDFVVGISADASVKIRMVGMPAWDIYDYDRLEVQIYRTRADQSGPFYRLTTLPLSFNSNDGYISYSDTASDEDLSDLDSINTALYGAELGTGLSEPVRAKYCTSADNRLILSNVKDYPTIDMQLLQNNTGPITIANLIAAGNNKYLFRKASTDILTVTNMVDRATYQFINNSTAVTLTPAADFTLASANVLNIASVAHGLAVGDWVYFYHNAVGDNNNLDFTGWFQVSAIPTANSFRINTVDARAGTAADADRYITATVKTDIPVLLGTDGNYGMLNGNRDTAVIPTYEFLAIRRLANAINCSMRKVDTSLTGLTDFSPWMIANAGNEFVSGQLIIKQPKILPSTMELALPALTGSFDIFVNNVRRAASAQAGAITKLFPSRTLISFPNFPELFDRPTANLDVDSESAIDVNPADGQASTSIIPFFGDSAFGASQKGAIIVNFKENSIYLLNTAAKQAGENPTQRIESEGKGCTAPFSVAVTKSGIMFANFAGIYRLTRDLSIDYIGRRYERIWKEQINRDRLDIATGHHFANGNQYKLSVPNGSGQAENNQAAVYNHTREYQQEGPGSWSTYTDHSATGWANLLDDAYFGTVDGQVYSIRRVGDVTDHRDDGQNITWNLLLRAMDFGDNGIRKVFNDIVTQYRTLVQTSSVTLKSATDLRNQLTDTTAFNVNNETDLTGLGDIVQRKVVSIRSSLATRLGVYLQLCYGGSSKDQPVEISGIAIRVAGLSTEGITEAAET